MKADRWGRVQEIFHQIRSAAGSERETTLDEACAGDTELRNEVESLLEHAEVAHGDFLTPPRINLAGDSEASDRCVRTWAERLIGQQHGRYTYKRLIAVGGMGAVFEAIQEQPARAVAVKVMQPGLSAGSALARFRLEPELLGRLRHQNIAQVFEAGVCEDESGVWPYFAMELILEARSLLEYAEAHGLALRDKLELFIKVCDGVHHGHQLGIIHRDLKPANVLVGANGEPKIIDFGVARATDSDVTRTSQHTNLGDLVGTVHYMSPEQCDGDPRKVDTRTDIYSLGVILYELLTGNAPYETSGKTVYSAIRIVKEAEPALPSKLERRLRGNLDSLLLKCLEKEPDRRYASAAALADDLRRHLSGEPIEARPPTLPTRLIRWAFRHPVVTTGLACAAIVASASLLLGLGLTGYYLAAQRPHDLKLNDDQSAVQLRTVAGLPLHDWNGHVPRGIKFHGIVPRVPDLGGGRLALVGYSAKMPEPPFGAMAAYNLTQSLTEPELTLTIEDAAIPPILRERERTEKRMYGAGTYGVAVGLVADVFPDPGGVASDELVVVHQHEAVTMSAIRVYALDGQLLYQAWIDAQIVDLEWLAKPRLLVCAGANGEAYLKDRGFSEEADPHPWVVFAIRPIRDFTSNDLIRQGPDSRINARPELLPVWYYMVYASGLYGRTEVPEKWALQPTSRGDAIRDAVIFSVSVKPEADFPVPEGTLRSWLISADGTVTDYPATDHWKIHGANDVSTDTPLPRYDGLHLDELAPIQRSTE